MVTRLDTAQPSNHNTDADFPHGAPRNNISPNDKTGTKWVESWVKDIEAFKQAILIGASVTPNGTPDTAVASQLYEALKLHIPTAKGYYDPAHFNGLNFGSFTDVKCQYVRLGQSRWRVSYYGRGTPGGSGLAGFDLTLPSGAGSPASPAIASAAQIIGSGAAFEEPAGDMVAVQVIGKVSNGYALVRFYAGSTNTHLLAFSFDISTDTVT